MAAISKRDGRAWEEESKFLPVEEQVDTVAYLDREQGENCSSKRASAIGNFLYLDYNWPI